MRQSLSVVSPVSKEPWDLQTQGDTTYSYVLAWPIHQRQTISEVLKMLSKGEAT